MKNTRFLLCVGALGACAFAGACDDDGSSAPRTVTLSGVAYKFASSGSRVAGAEVRIAEDPDLVTTSAADGTWSLEVPADADATPYVTDPDFVTMHVETFAVGREPIDDINFQMVPPDVFATLAAVLQITPDPAKCQIASTVSTKDIQPLTFDGFIAYGAHGVADATVAITPAATDTVYFNEQTIPIRTLTATTNDGGVLWANVAPGRYTLHATHATRRFADVVVTCEAGRFINANPPRGLREL